MVSTAREAIDAPAQAAFDPERDVLVENKYPTDSCQRGSATILTRSLMRFACRDRSSIRTIRRRTDAVCYTEYYCGGILAHVCCP
jgi:hypothetical protein